MSKFIILAILTFLALTIATPTNCNSEMAMQVLGVEDVTDILSMPDIAKCAEADLCRVDCKTINGKKNEVVMMKVDLSSPHVSSALKNAYYKNCAWELERHEILTDAPLPPAKGRGQIISQYIAHIGRVNRAHLPAVKFPKPLYPNVPVAPKTKGYSTSYHAATIRPDTIRPSGPNPHRRSSVSHANTIPADTGGKKKRTPRMSSTTNHANSIRQVVGAKSGIKPGKYEGQWVTPEGRIIWTPTIKVMADWVDYLIYASNQFTLFRDLCRESGDIDQTAKKFKYRLIEDGKKGISALYAVGIDRVKIESFVVSSATLITSKFVDLYKNPQKTCSCQEIVASIPASAETKKFTATMSASCPNVHVPSKKENNKRPMTVKRPIHVTPIRRPIHVAPIKRENVKRPVQRPVHRPIRTPVRTPDRDDDNDHHDDDEDDE